MNFSYTAKSMGGSTSSGVLCADSLAGVQRQLREQGLFPISVQERPGGTGAKPVKWFGRKRVSKRDLLTFTTQLAVMSRAGMDLAGSIQSTAKQCPNPTLKASLEKVHAAVSSGVKVSAALASQSHVFGDAYVASIAAGEASGKLSEVLSRLSQLLRGEMRLRSTLRTLLSYPILLTSVCVLVILAMMFFVLPQFAGVFEQLGVPLPASTKILLAIGLELRGHWYIWGGLIVGLPVCLIVWFRRPSGRAFRDIMALNVPLLRNVTRSLLAGRTFRLLGTMIESGIPLMEGLYLTQSAVRNSLYRSMFEKIRNEVLNGGSMGATLADSPFVPVSAGQMVLTAERTGTMGSVMQLMGEFYEDEGETRLRELATILEPLIIIVMGTVVGFVVMSLMLPLFSFATIGEGPK